MKGLRRIPELARTLGVPEQTLRYWIDHDTSFPKPVDRQKLAAGRHPFGRPYHPAAAKTNSCMWLLPEVQAWFAAKQASDKPHKPRAARTTEDE